MTDEIRHKIEAYLGGTLSAEEARLFEQEMEQDVVLAKEVELSRQINHHLKGDMAGVVIPENEYTEELRTYLRSDEAREMKEKIESVQREYKMQTSFRRKRSYLLVAATIALLLVSTIGYNYFGKTSPDQLYAQYYSAADLPSIINRDTSSSLFEQGVLKFQKGEYAKALNDFNSYKTEAASLDPSVYLYTGIAQLELNNSQEAIKEFDTMAISNSLDASRGLWFKALTYLKIDETKQAKLVLNEILKDTSNFNYAKAKELLDEL